jgi:type I restriction enzyme M protein
MNNNSLDITSLENWLWEAACKIRGEIDAPKYKDYILPLIFLKRLSDVFDDEISRLTDDYGSEEIARQLAAQDHSLVRFYIPKAALWSKISLQPTGIGEYLTDAIRAVSKEN